MAEPRALGCEACPFNLGETILGCQPQTEQLRKLAPQQLVEFGACALARMDEARTDDLTRLPNIKTLKGMVAEELASGEPRPILVWFADGNRMKKVNDEQGHEVGDEVITGISSELETSLALGMFTALGSTVRLRDRRHHDMQGKSVDRRTTGDRRQGSDRLQRDLLGRRSGDEFIGVCYDVTPEEAVIIEQRIDAAVSTPFPVATSAGEIMISATTKFVYVSEARTLQDVLDAIDRADKGLNIKKSAQRKADPRP